MKSSLFLSPVAVGVLGVAIALSVVVGIVVNYTSRESTVIDTTAASRMADLQRAAGQSGSNVGIVVAPPEIPEFELNATPEPLPATAEPDALIWWDSKGEPTATTEPSPTVEPSPTATHTPIPTPPLPPTLPPPPPTAQYQTQMNDGWIHIIVPGGMIPCHHLGRAWNGDVFANGPTPLRDWFNALPMPERQEILSYCGG